MSVMSSEKRLKETFAYTEMYRNIYAMPEDLQGVYVFCNRHNGRCIYIGETTSFKARLNKHWKGTHNDELQLWLKGCPESIIVGYWEVKGDKMWLKRVQDRLIYKWNPETNIDGVPDKKDN